MQYRNTKTLRYYIACLTIFIVPLWRPINEWVIGIDGAGRIPLFLSLITMLLWWTKIKLVLFKKPVVYYLFFALFVFINAMLKQSYLTFEGDGVYIIFVNLFVPIMYMMIIAMALKLNFCVTLKWLMRSLLVCCLLCIIFGDMQDTGRLGGDINANAMAVYGDFCFFCLLLQYIRNYRSFLSFLLFSIVPILLILFTGSRTAFVILVFVSFLSVLLFYKKRRIGSLIMILCVNVTMVVGCLYVMDNTVLGERLMGSTTQMEGLASETGTLLDKFGDRGPQYYWSWPYFKQNPFSGIGINNWRKVSGSPYVFHSEWLVQYCENGLCALFLYLLFYISLLRKMTIVQKYDKSQNVKTIRFVKYVLFSVFLMNFVSWTYNSYCVFSFYAMAVVLSNKKCFKSNETKNGFTLLLRYR